MDSGQKKVRRPDRRLERNRKALMRAAQSLFAEKGFEQVTIDRIAESAELAKGTFYHYFEDKDAIASEVALESRRSLELEVRAAQEGIEDPAQRLALGISVFLWSAVKEPARAGIVAQMFSQWLRPEASGNEQLRKDLEDGYRNGRFTSGELGAAVVMTVGLVQAGIQRALAIRNATETRTLTLQLCALELRGLGVAWNQAQSIAAKAVAQVLTMD